MEAKQDFLREIPNLDYVVELVGTQDFEFQAKFVAIMKTEYTSDLGKYLYHIKIGEPRTAAELVHKLKYKFSVLGMEKTFEFAEAHKEKLESGDTSLDDVFKVILKKVSNFLDQA
ncbi:Hpt domain-containing protein [Cytophaga sp. FL35]|uniref:Hpt domain-containing protein n=1 Tax=Cytophaga sp. FL35 TaxID=1904456 RepID=UPI00165358AE|nr:Hpt domain-containing protein [Cytophaga sp. FL35]MBC6997223.1 Hpt domain-containing protein [Cytophaga sp. FL35]